MLMWGHGGQMGLNSADFRLSVNLISLNLRLDQSLPCVLTCR